MKTKGQQFIERTSQHTFMNASGYFFKTILIEDKVIAITFKESFAKVDVYKAESFNNVSSKGKNYVSTWMRSMLFPGYNKQFAIPTFNTIKTLVNDIKEIIKDKDINDVAVKNLIIERIKKENLSKK